MKDVRIEPTSLKALLRIAANDGVERVFEIDSIALQDGTFYATDGRMLMRLGPDQGEDGEKDLLRRDDVEAAVMVAAKATDRIIIEDEHLSVWRASTGRVPEGVSVRVLRRTEGAGSRREYPAVVKMMAKTRRHSSEQAMYLGTAYLKAICQAVEDLGDDKVSIRLPANAGDQSGAVLLEAKAVNALFALMPVSVTELE